MSGMSIVYLHLILKKNNIQYVIGISRIEDEQELHLEIDNVQPTHIISFIGRTHGQIGTSVYSTIDYLEEKGKLHENVRDNLFEPYI